MMFNPCPISTMCLVLVVTLCLTDIVKSVLPGGEAGTGSRMTWKLKKDELEKKFLVRKPEK